MFENLKKGKLYFSDFFLIIWTFFSIGFVYFHSTEAVYMYNTERFWSPTLILTAALLIIMFFFKHRISSKKMIVMVLLCGLSLLIFLKMHGILFAVQILFFVIGQFVDFDKFIKYDLKLKAVLFGSVVLLCCAGILNNYIGNFYDGTVKMALGFTHPNIFACFGFSILIEWLYVRAKKITIGEILLILAGFAVIVYFAAARTTSYTFMAIFVLYMLFRFFPKIFNLRIVHAAFVLITPVLAVSSFAATYLYGHGNRFARKLNELLSERLSYSWYFLSHYGVSLFGRKMEFTSTRTSKDTGAIAMILDNAYVRCGLAYGIIFLVFFCVAYVMFFHWCIKKKHIDLALFALYYILIGLGESYTISLFYNLSIICMLGTLRLYDLHDPFKLKIEELFGKKKHILVFRR